MAKKSLEEIFGSNQVNQQSIEQPIQQDNRRPLTDIFSDVQQSQSQPQTQFQQPEISISEPTKNPISNLDRLKLSFSDDEGKELYLKKRFNIVERLPNGKFAVGDNPNSVLPVDPEGVFNDVLGDLADVVGEIPVIAGQILGATAGGVSGSVVPGAGTTAGIITGGAAGAGAGEAVKIGIGRALGVREQKAMDEATDIAISSAFGAAGEGLAKGLQLGGKFLKGSVTKNMARKLDKAAKVDTTGTGVKTVAKTLKILANVPEESTETVFKHGIERTLGNPKNLQKEGVVPVVNKTIEALEEVTTRLGKDVGKQVRLLESAARRTGKSSRIQVDDLFPVLKREAQAIGFLDDFGKINKNLPFEQKDIKPITAMLREFGEFRNGAYVQFPGKTIPVKKALQITRSFGNKFERLTPQGQRILGESLDAFRGKLTAKANELGVDGFAKANQRYSDFLNLRSQLKRLDPKNLDGMEKFVKGLERQGEFTKQSLRDLQNLSKVQFLDNWEMWNAAQDFTSASPNLLRFGMIASTLGLTSGFETKTEKIGTFSGAMLLGTPAGQRIILRTLAKTGGIPRTATGAARKTLDTKTATAVLSRLLEQQSGVNNQVQTNGQNQ